MQAAPIVAIEALWVGAVAPLTIMSVSALRCARLATSSGDAPGAKGLKAPRTICSLSSGREITPPSVTRYFSRYPV